MKLAIISAISFLSASLVSSVAQASDLRLSLGVAAVETSVVDFTGASADFAFVGQTGTELGVGLTSVTGQYEIATVRFTDVQLFVRQNARITTNSGIFAKAGAGYMLARVEALGFSREERFESVTLTAGFFYNFTEKLAAELSLGKPFAVKNNSILGGVGVSYSL